MNDINDNRLTTLYQAKIPNDYERAFVVMLTEYLVFDTLPEVSPATWQDAEIEARVQDVRIPTGNRANNGGLALAAYSTHYLAEHLDKGEIVNTLSAALSSEPHQPLAVFTTFGRKFGKNHIFDVFFAQHQKRIAKFNPDTFLDLFKYPCWLEFSKTAKKQIHTAILEGQLSAEAINYYLGAVERHEDYVELFPVIRHIIKTTSDAGLLWIAGDVLNLIWLNLPDDDESLQQWFHQEIYNMFYPRIGSSWPIVHHDSVQIEDADARRIFEDSYGWLTSLSDLGEFNPELKDVSTRPYDNKKHRSLKKFILELLRDSDHIDFDDSRIEELNDNFDEIIKIAADSNEPAADVLVRIYRLLCHAASPLKSADALAQLGDKIKDIISRHYADSAQIYSEAIDILTAFARHTITEYQREQADLSKNLIQHAAKFPA